MTKYIFAQIVLCLYTSLIVAQTSVSLDANAISIGSHQWTEAPIAEVIKKLENISGYGFQYNPGDIENQSISLTVKDESLHGVLSNIAEKTNLLVKIRSNEVIIYKPRNEAAGEGSAKNTTKTINGYIYDEESSESLIGATVYDLNSGTGTTTNVYGFYSLTLPAGNHNISISYIGYHEKLLEINLEEDTKRSAYMQSSSTRIEEVVITSNSSDTKHKRTQMSQHNIAVEKLDAIPVILGERDVLKSIQLLPGIKSGTEGTSGIYVRGGGHDQNLILLDGVPVYNPAHALGIFSVFNSDALKSVNVIKSGHPARYGGRLSSVIDVRMKEGNLQEWHGEGSIGLISSKLSLSGPIVKDKVSILASGRRTYADLVLSPLLQSGTQEDIDPALFFHDFNAKLQYKVNDKSRIYMSGYWGKDNFGASFSDSLSTQTSLYKWGNAISAIRWNYEISPKLFTNTTLTYSDYEINTINENETFENKEVNGNNYSSGIEDFGGKIDFDWIPHTNHYFKFGGSFTRHFYNPGINTTVRKLGDDDNSTQRRVRGPDADEIVFYVEDEMKLGKLSINAGLHNATFQVENSNYNSLQPRIGLRYLVNDNLSFKASYNTMTQFLNLVSSESLSLPSDVWVPSTDEILPQYSRQYAIGIGGSQGVFDWEVESYYKEFDNVLSFIEGTTLLNTNPEDWENEITQGKGDAYGVEFLLKKTKGKLSGWIAYTLSWSNRQFDDINGGKQFPFRFDRRHDLSITGSYKIKEGINFSANFIYNTGNAITVPEFQYLSVFPNSRIPRFYEVGGQKNAARMSPSHRLDWSLSFTKEKKKYTRTWVIGAYNTYNRGNPFYAKTNKETITDETTGEIIGITQNIEEKSLLPILPTISYQFKF